MKPTGVERINPALSAFVVDVVGLKPDPKNPRAHPKHNLTALVESLKRFGQQKPVVARKDGTLVAGHGLVEAAKELGWKRVAAVVTDLDDESAIVAYEIADNRTAELSTWNYETLGDLLRNLQAQAPELIVGWDPTDLQNILQASAFVRQPVDDEFAPGQARHTIPFTAEQYDLVIRVCRVWREKTGHSEATDAEVICEILKEYGT